MRMVCIRLRCLERRSRFSSMSKMPRHRLCVNAEVARYFFCKLEDGVHE
jgi:hypothetical protein